MRSKLRIHIATLDHHVERITEPMISLHADKAYIIAFKEKDSSYIFLEKTKKSLEKHRIKVTTVYADIWNLLECITKFREIIREEKENHVFVNLSTGTKISCISAMMACMIWNCEPYYAKSKYQDIKIPKKIKEEKIGDIVSIPTYKMHIPKSEFLTVLDVLNNNEGKMKKKEIIMKLKELKIIYSVDDHVLSKQAEHGQLKTILEPMLDEEYIYVETVGRNSVVNITQQGKNTLKIFKN